MLKILQPNVYNLKCGEIFCISPAVYNVTCCLCATKMHLEQFTSHFQVQHLTLAEESINLEELEEKRKAKLAKDANLVDNIAIKEEDPEDDPIKQEDSVNDDKSVQHLIRDSKNATEMQQQRTDDSFVIEVKDLSIAEKLETDTFRKPFTRNTKKLQTKATSLIHQDEKQDLQQFDDVDQNNIKTTKENEVVYNDLEKDKEYEDYDDNDMDADWSLEDKYSDTDYDNDKDSLNDELPYPCLICKRSYRSKRSLQKHKYSVHNPERPSRKSKMPKVEHKCDECNESFRSVRELRGHKWKHTGIFCDICGKPFTQTGNMLRHKIRHTGIKAYKCKECGKEFFTNKELKSHLICHTGLMPIMCEICGKRCRDRGVLTAHMRRHTGERPAKCEVCGKSFFSYHDLNVHAVTHSSERPFKCDICGSTFQRKKALRVHKLIHSKDRKHVCKICGKGFAQSGGLNSHMRTHDAALETSTTETVILQTATENQTTFSTTTNSKATNNTAAVSITQDSNNSHTLERTIVVSEYRGSTLQDKSKSSLNLALILRIFYQIASALNKLNEHRIVAHNLEPKNILLDQHDNIKLFNYGLYYMTKGGEYVAFPIGNIKYSPPERLLGVKNNIKSDIWSLAMIIAELLLQSSFWPNLKISAISRKILSFCQSNNVLEKIAREHDKLELYQQLNPDIRSILEQCLAVKPSERPLPEQLLTASIFLKNLDLYQNTPIEKSSGLLLRMPLEQIYYWWQLAGGDVQSELKKEGLIRSEAPILSIPQVVCLNGSIVGPKRSQSYLMDDRVVILKLQNLIDRLKAIPVMAFYPLIHSPKFPYNFGLGMEQLPLVIREKDIEYQFYRVRLFSRLLQGYPYTGDLIRKEANIDIPPLLRGPIWSCLLDVIPNGSYEKIDKFTPTSTDRQ